MISFRASDCGREHAPELQAKLIYAKGPDLFHGLFLRFNIAHNSLDDKFGPQFELGLDEQGKQGPRGKPGHTGRQNKREGNKGKIAGQKFNRLGYQVRRGITQIDALMADHTFIRAQFFMQLVLAHIHGIDPGCATLQQAM